MSNLPSYAEASYFDGFAFAHIAAREEQLRLRALERKASQHLARDRRTGGRRA